MMSSSRVTTDTDRFPPLATTSAFPTPGTDRFRGEATGDASVQQLATPEHPMYNWANPKRVGPGSWYTFMLSAYISDTQEKRDQTCLLIRSFCDHFKCGDCSGHCKAYVETHPPEIASSSPRLLFDWIITFLNAVNHRQAKPAYDANLMWEMFDKKEFKFCNANCDKKTPAPQKTYKRNVPSRFASSPSFKGQNTSSSRVMM